MSAVFLATTLFACGGGGSSSTTSESRSEYYPEGVVVSSPLITGTARSSAKSLATFDDTAEDISGVLSATTLAECGFDPSAFLSKGSDASCFGPTVVYSAGHPDNAGAPAGSLPGKDVGLWLETNGGTEACAAAELNAGMSGIGNRSNGALKAAASMICVNNVSGYALPVSSTSDITAEMNNMATAAGMSATFTSGTITHSVDGAFNVYTYYLEYSYTSGSDPYPMTLTVTHRSEDETEYTGRISYTVGNIDALSTANCPLTKKTYLGSVLYEKAGSDIKMDARTTENCGGAVTNGFASGLVDPSYKYDAVTRTDGWSDDFNKYIASYNYDTQVGTYTYAWQAGVNDNNTRVFNINITKNSTTSLLEGEAWYGYGDDAATTDNSIAGMICNWTGPGSGPAGSKTISPYTQYQSIQQNVSGVFIPVVSNLAYTIMNSCGVGEVNATAFVFDTDNDGSYADEAVPANFTNLLKAYADYTSGFTLPTSPTNF